MTHGQIRDALRQAPKGAIVRAVYAAVMLHIGKNGEPCTASIQTLADEAGVNIKTAKRALSDLVPVWLERVDTPGKPSRFSIPTPPTPRAHPETGPPENDPTRTQGPEVKNPRSTTSEGSNGRTLFDGPQAVPSRTPASVPPPARARATPPNAPIFEALITAAGWDIGNLTGTQRSRTGKAAKELAAVGATPAEITEQADVLELAWGSKPAPWTIASHWGSQPRAGRADSTWKPRRSS